MMIINRFQSSSVCLAFLAVAAFLGFVASGLAQEEEEATNRLALLDALTGNWVGAGDGKWGRSSIGREIEWTLGGKFIWISGISSYPAQPLNPQGETHESHSYLSFDTIREAIVLRQLDSESHVTTFLLDWQKSDADTFVFVSREFENLPPSLRVRLTYELISRQEYLEVLELDFDGDGYVVYLINRLRRDD